MTNIPSTKTLSLVFADKAKEARRIMEMTREQLEQLPACDALIRASYGRHSTMTLRMEALNALDAGCYGVECLRSDKGIAEYINTGDTYSPTVLFWQGRYRVTTWGDFVETMQRRSVHFE